MKFALHFANVSFPDSLGAKRVAAAAEAAGFESLVCPEHVVWPVEYKSVYPYSPTGKLPGGPQSKMPDPLIWMAFVAGITERLRFITGVMILPQRNPVVLAKEVATLDHLSEGRVSLGVGVGWLKEEFDAMNAPYADRGARTDEYIEVMRALWAQESSSYHGETIAFDDMCCYPKPANGDVPILIGGHSQAAARRAGRLGNGFFPAVGAQRDVFPLVEVARQSAAEHGRDPSDIEISTGCPGALPESSDHPLTAVEERAGRGVDRVVLPLPAFMPDIEKNLETFSREVIERVD